MAPKGYKSDMRPIDRTKTVYDPYLEYFLLLIGVCRSPTLVTRGAGSQLYLKETPCLNPPSPPGAPTLDGGKLCSAVEVPGRGVGPSFACSGRGFATPTGMPTQACLSVVRACLSCSELGGRIYLSVRTPDGTEVGGGGPESRQWWCKRRVMR